jgi:DNA-binding transcriptional MerR regulator
MDTATTPDGARLKIGELARRTALSVRTIRFYEQLGLLHPSERTEGGHRIYARHEVARLQRISSLRRLGLTLAEVGEVLDGGMDALGVVQLQLQRLRERVRAEQLLCRRLERISAQLEAGEPVSVDDFIQIIEETKMADQMSPELQQRLKELHQDTGTDRIHEVETVEWPALYDEVRAAMREGADPAGETVQALVRRWQGLVEEFTKGDPEITRAVAQRNRADPTAAGRMPADMADMMEFIGTAAGWR